MPTYEYKCDACGNAFERFQTMSAAPVKKCPKCGKNKVRRLVGMGAGLIFKGSGFYITDYRSENYKAGAKKEAPATPSPAIESKSGDKPATAPAKPAAPAPKSTEAKG